MAADVLEINDTPECQAWMLDSGGMPLVKGHTSLCILDVKANAEASASYKKL